MSPRVDSYSFPKTTGTNNTFISAIPQKPVPFIENQKTYIRALPSTYRLLDNSILRGIYSMGSWADRNLKSTPINALQTSLGAAGGYINAQSGLNEEYLEKALKRTPLPWLDKDFFNNHYPSEFKPSALMRGLGYAGKGLDAVTGVINLAQEFKKDIDTDNNSLSNTLNASIRSVGQISLGSLAGVAAAGLVAGSTAPLLLGAAAGVAAGYASGYVYDTIRDWLF